MDCQANENAVSILAVCLMLSSQIFSTSEEFWKFDECGYCKHTTKYGRGHSALCPVHAARHLLGAEN